jgi:hypothetical protein
MNKKSERQPIVTRSVSEGLESQEYAGPRLRFGLRFHLLCGLLLLAAISAAEAREPDRVVDIWPGMAPRETTQDTGEALPRRADENPPATRIARITQPRLHIFDPPAEKKGASD